MSEGVTSTKGTDKTKINKLKNSNFYRIVNSDVKANLAFSTVQKNNPEYSKSMKDKFKDKVDMEEQIRVRTIKRFFE